MGSLNSLFDNFWGQPGQLRAGPRRGPSALLLLAALASACGGDDPEPEAQPTSAPFSVMTYNVLCSFCGSGEYDTWDERQPYFKDTFARYDADLIGLQELAFGTEVDQLLTLMDGYASVYYAAVDSNLTYPDATVLYRTERFELLESGQFWLSPTPDVPSSTGFAEQQLPRLVAWTKLRDLQTGQVIYFASTHVDNNSPSQAKSAPLILERAAPWAAEAPVVFLGDFNSKPDTEAYQILTTSQGFHFVNSQALAKEWLVDSNETPVPTYDLADRIDHIFLGSGAVDWSVSKWSVDVHRYGPNQRYPSDHFPMAAVIQAADR